MLALIRALQAAGGWVGGARVAPQLTNPSAWDNFRRMDIMIRLSVHGSYDAEKREYVGRYPYLCFKHAVERSVAGDDVDMDLENAPESFMKKDTSCVLCR